MHYYILFEVRPTQSTDTNEEQNQPREIKWGRYTMQHGIKKQTKKPKQQPKTHQRTITEDPTGCKVNRFFKIIN